MTDTYTETAPAEGQPSTETFGSDTAGLRKAAAELTAQRPQSPEDEKPELELPEEGVTAREAARKLTAWRQEKERERDAFESAIRGETLEQTAPPAREEPPSTVSGPDPTVSLHEAQAARQTATSTLGVAQQLILADFSARFPDIRSDADLVRLQYEDPIRLAELEEYSAQARQGMQALAAQEQSQHGAVLEAHERWGQEQDKKWLKDHPELSDAKVFRKFSEAALSTLLEAGFSRDDIMAAWSGAVGLPLRAAAVQSLLLDAVRFRLATKSVRDGKGRKPAPPVQRPGAAGNRLSAGEILVHDAESAMNKNPSIRNAARLLGARRRATG